MPTAPPRHGARKRIARRQSTQRDYDRHRRKNAGFYHSTAWRKLRAEYAKQNPLCVMCKAGGIIKELDVVDHIIEIEDGGAPLDWSNLQSLCHDHHNKKSAQAREGRVKSL